MNTQELIESPKTRNIIFLMPSKTASAVIAARPELKKIKKEGDRTLIRKLGQNGDPSTKVAQLSEFDDAVVIGFSIPVNVSARAEQVIEIPIGRSVDRKNLNNTPDEDLLQSIAKGLAEMSNMTLRAYFTRIEALGATASEEDEEEETPDF